MRNLVQRLDTPYVSFGAVVVLTIACVSTLAYMSRSSEESQGMRFWIFAKVHGAMYSEQITDWNDRALASDDSAMEPVTISVLDMSAIVRRSLSAFWADTPVADLIEVEINQIGLFVSGPVEDVGFTDLTDRLKEEGIYEQINAPSFSPWTTRGHIVGLPHDVHPVVLCYRADLVEEAGIDVSEVETWDDFVRVFKPLLADTDDDGRTDRYLLNMWYTQGDPVAALLLQAGGGTFGPDGESLIASDANARVISTVVSWCFGPDRIAIDAPEFSPAGNNLKLNGKVIASIMPDWLGGTWKTDMPQLEGKLKMMPLPAWEPGGRRTSVWGGTMLGIPKATEDFEAAWAFAKHLYLSEELARALYESTYIISPVRSLWDSEFYKQPDPYFSGQRVGELLIDLAPDVPLRTSSPFRAMAQNRIMEALNALRRHAEETQTYDVESLMPEAKRLLEAAEQRIEKEMARNVFLQEETP